MVATRIDTVRANGLAHAVHHFYDPAAPDGPRRHVLCVHGFLDAGSTFDLLAAPLVRAGYHVVVPDLRGFGATERIGAGGYYHFPDYVADLDELVEALAPTWLGVVGHSMGGGVATMFAGTFPARVQKLVVMEGLGPMAEPPELAALRVRRWVADKRRFERTPRTMTREEAFTRLAATHPRIDEAILRSRLDLLVVDAGEGRVAFAWDPLHRSVAPTPFNPAVFASFVREVACPTLFVDGGPHGWHPPDEAERLEGFRALTVASFPDAGHMMHWTAPEPVGARIAAFLDQT